MIPAILVNYNFSPKDWWTEYGFETTVYDRSDDGIERVFDAKTYKTKNTGNVDYDKLSYLVENYDDLPDVFLWGKTNLFKYISKEEFDKVAQNKEFTPLLTQNHRIYSNEFGRVNYYSGGIYHEVNSSWIFNNDDLASTGQFQNWSDWAATFRLPNPAYIPFTPGGNYILTKEKVHKYSRDYYAHMRDVLPYAKNPVEAHAAERSYYLMWK